MRRRAFRIALLLVQAVWLNIVVPGHRRGIVSLPGEACATCEAQTVATNDCCASYRHDRNHQAPQKHGDPARHCLICYFAARVTPPPVIDFTPPPLRLVDKLPLPAAEIVTFRPSLPTYDGRAPPICDLA